MMNYFEKSLGDTVERRGDRFIIKAEPNKNEYNFRLPLLPSQEDERKNEKINSEK